MGFTSGGCRDLSEYQNDPKVFEIVSKLVSGGIYGYETVIEKKEEIKKCPACNIILKGIEKFCPECGAKMDWTKKSEDSNQKTN